MLITARENNTCLLGLKLLNESLSVDTLKKADTHKDVQLSEVMSY